MIIKTTLPKVKVWTCVIICHWGPFIIKKKMKCTISVGDIDDVGERKGDRNVL